MPSVREEQDHAVDAAITRFERYAALEGLDVRDPRLSLHPEHPVRPEDLSIPGT